MIFFHQVLDRIQSSVQISALRVPRISRPQVTSLIISLANYRVKTHEACNIPSLESKSI